MKHSSPRDIQQQMYTRERRGIFRAAEGFDTVAKSPGLEGAFVKKVLHPFCMYDAPAELTARGEKDGALYPGAVHLFHTEGGDTVLGRSVYQPVDFTGLRSAFFTHNYVIPKERSEEIVADYRSWLGAAFAGGYDAEQGTELPELPDIPRSVEAGGPEGQAATKEFLARLGLDELLFKQLLFAVMTASGEGRKKIYISLDVPVEDISREALSLLEVLYSCLPYEFRRRLGFLSYSKEPLSKKHIHLQFVEKGSLRPQDRSIEKDFVFDMAARRFTPIDLDWSRQPYLDLAWNHLGRREELEEFFSFADDMLEGMGHERKAAISSYHELAVFYQIQSGKDALYEDHKSAVLRGLLDYLRPPGSLESRMALNDLFLSRFDREFDLVRQGRIPDLAVAECIRDYFGIPGAGQESKVISYFIRMINNALQQGQRETVEALYTLIEGHPGLNEAFFESILANEGLSRALFEPYIRDKFNKAADIRGILNLIHSWGLKHAQVLYDPSFQEAARNRLMDKLRSHSHVLNAVNLILLETGKWSSSPSSADNVFQDSGIIPLLSTAATRVLLNELEWDRLTREQLLRAEFLARMDGEAWVREQKDARLSCNAAVLYAAYRLFTEEKPSSDVLSGLGLMEVDRVQQLARRWLQGEITPSEFYRIALAFHKESDSGYVEYAALLDYLRKNAGNKEMIYKFMLWSQKHPDFARPRGLVPAYASAILSYFKRHDKSAFKSREYRRNYFSQADSALGAVFEKAKLELASPLSRLWSRNKRRIVTLSAAAGLLVILIVGGLLVLKETGVIGSSDPANEPPLVTDVGDQVPERIVFAEKVKVTEGGQEKEVTKLTFPFDDLTKCSVFDPSSLKITVSGQEPQELSLLDYTRVCNSDETDEEDAAVPGSDEAQNGSEKGAAGENQGDEPENAKQNGSNPGAGTGEADKTGTAGGATDGTADTDDTASDSPAKDAANSTSDDPSEGTTTGKSDGMIDSMTDSATGMPGIKFLGQYAGLVTVVLDQIVTEGSVITVGTEDFLVKELKQPEPEPEGESAPADSSRQ